MRVVWGIDTRLSRPSCLALGVFDGVHLGHQKVIGAAVAQAASSGVMPAVLTFDPHPDAIVKPQGAPPLLTPTEEKLGILRRLGVKLTVIARFDRSLAAMPAERFVTEILLTRLRARCIVVGAGWRFGAGGRGSPESLDQMASAGTTRLLRGKGSFGVTTIPPILANGEPVSSTRVRRLLLNGAVEEANALLGRPYSMAGRVVTGDRLGRTLGFPTANLDLPSEKLIPADGVYACHALQGRGRAWPAVAYIGARPTVSATGVRRVEVHLLERRGPVGAPGSLLRVELVSRLRPDRRFPSPEALVAQMKADVATAGQMLGIDVARRRTTW